MKTMPLDGDVCFAIKKSSERELFVPDEMHLGVRLLRKTCAKSSRCVIGHGMRVGNISHLNGVTR